MVSYHAPWGMIGCHNDSSVCPDYKLNIQGRGLNQQSCAGRQSGKGWRQTNGSPCRSGPYWTDWLTDWLRFFSMYPKNSKKVCCIKGSCITRAECWPGYRVQCVSSMGHSDVVGKHFKQGNFPRGSNNNQVLEFRSIFAKLFAELLPGFSRSRIH